MFMNKYLLPGTDVPIATKLIAVTASFSPIQQPKCEAKSPTIAVNKPITNIDVTKHAQPPQ